MDCQLVIDIYKQSCVRGNEHIFPSYNSLSYRQYINANCLKSMELLHIYCKQYTSVISGN